MRLLIDTNIFHKFFNVNHKEHNEFKKAHKCLFDCKGVMLFGGSTFEKEINISLSSYKKILIELSKSGKFIQLDKSTIDLEEKRIKLLEKSNDFDDPHIISCVINGKIQIICSDDSRADKYIKDPKFYPKQFSIPKIYRKSIHHKLLNDCF